MPSCAWFLCPLRFVIYGNFNIKMLLQAITHVLNTAEGQDEGKKLKIIVLTSKLNGQQHNYHNDIMILYHQIHGVTCGYIGDFLNCQIFKASDRIQLEHSSQTVNCWTAARSDLRSQHLLDLLPDPHSHKNDIWP